MRKLLCRIFLQRWVIWHMAVMLQYLSTSPEQEPPDFVSSVRAALLCMQTHPKPLETLFPDGKSKYYRLDNDGQWTEATPESWWVHLSRISSHCNWTAHKDISNGLFIFTVVSNEILFHSVIRRNLVSDLIYSTVQAYTFYFQGHWPVHMIFMLHRFLAHILNHLMISDSIGNVHQYMFGPVQVDSL